MKQDTEEQAGIIEQGDLKVTFYAKGFCFTFLPYVSYDEIDSPGHFLGMGEYGVLRPEGKFIKGFLFSGKEIWINCDRELHLRPYASLNTVFYLVGGNNDNLESFDTVTFEGGSLVSIFQQDSMIIEESNDSKNNKRERKVGFNNDEILCDVDSDTIKSLRVFSYFTTSFSVTDGNRIENRGPVLSIHFKQAVSISDELLGVIRDFIPHQKKDYPKLEI